MSLLAEGHADAGDKTAYARLGFDKQNQHSSAVGEVQSRSAQTFTGTHEQSPSEALSRGHHHDHRVTG